MKVRSKKEIQKATNIFTDREEPRKSFWKKYHAFANDDTIQVLSYYGIGGIGKTSLLKKLIQEMDEKLYKPYHVYYDFKYGQQCHQVLNVIRERLASSYNFTFPLFELGLYSYCNKVGIKADSIEVKKLTEQSPTLDLLLDIVGNIPMVGMATTIFSLADKSAAFLLTQLKNHKKELLEIEYMDAEDLYKHLPYLFSQDLSNNLEKVTMPLVVFLDTYESLVNELHSMGEPLLNDTWIRSETGIIQNTSNVLWVIAGREKLKWNMFDEGWDESLEQHMLGNLSLYDSDWFLKQAEVLDENLRNDLFGLTNGVPIYLDLCVERYRSLLTMNVVPTIEMFGTNKIELVERFVRYMTDSQKDLIYTFACLGTWTDELMMKIAETTLTSFSAVTYERCMEFSFVQQDEKGVYKLHDTMKEILFACCPKMIKESVAKCAFDYYDALYMDENMNRESKMLAMKRVLVFADLIFDEQQWISYLEDSYIEELSSSLHFEYSTNSNDIYHFLFSLIDRYANDKLKFVIYDSYSDYLLFIGEFEQAIEIAKEVVVLGEQLYGETSTITASKIHDLFILLYKTTHYEEAMECLEKLDLIIKNDEEQYKELVNEISVSLAAFHQLIGNYEEAIRCNLNMMNRIDEYSDEYKIVIMMNLANAYSNIKTTKRHCLLV